MLMTVFGFVRTGVHRVQMGHPWDRFQPKLRSGCAGSILSSTRRQGVFAGKKRLTRGLVGV